MVKRSLYYLSKMYEEQLNEKEDYSKLVRTVCINILNFKYLKTDNFHTGYRFKEIESNEELTDIMEVHFIEIPKLQDSSDEKDMLVAWTEFLKDPESEKVRGLELSIEEIRQAKDELIRMSNDSTQRELYDMRANSLRDKMSELNAAERKGIEKGREEGREEGRKEEKIKIPKSVQQALPIKAIFNDGIFQVGKEKYPKSFKFTDINYAVAGQEEQENMFINYGTILNMLDESADNKLTIINRKLKKVDFDSKMKLEIGNDNLTPYRKEYNDILASCSIETNGIIQEKLITNKEK